MDRNMFIKEATKLNVARFCCYMIMALGFFASGIVTRQARIIDKAYGLDKEENIIKEEK